MSTIYDRNRKVNNVDKEKIVGNSPQKIMPENQTTLMPQLQLTNHNEIEVEGLHLQTLDALSIVDDVVQKNYLTHLSNMDIVEISNISTEGIILFKVNKMVYEKDEYATEKFISVVNAMTYTNSSIFLIVDGHKDYTDFYLGIGCNDDNRTPSSVAETFRSAFCGQFPGACLEDMSHICQRATVSKQDMIFARMKEAKNISSCVGIPASKSTSKEYTNSNYIQGIEKLALAMRGKEYTAIVLAKNQMPKDIRDIRIAYETLYTQLSSQSSQQLAFSNSESVANSLSSTKGYSDSISVSEMVGKTHSLQYSKANTTGTSHSKGYSEQNKWGKAGAMAGPLMYAGAVLTASGVGAPVGAIMMGASAVMSAGGILKGRTNTSNDTTTESTTYSVGTSDGFTESRSESTSHADNFSMTNGQTATLGESKTVTLTVKDKHIDELLKRIDNQLERINQAESTGLWQTGAYFLSYENDRATAEIGATIFRSIMVGEESGVEISAINSWYLESAPKTSSVHSLPKVISSLNHPVFVYKNATEQEVLVSGTSLVNSTELAMMLGLPRKSVPGLPIIEHASLGKDIVTYQDYRDDKQIDLGCIFDYGVACENNKVSLNRYSLTQHVFITGSTGSGKSESVYKLINEARLSDVKFLIIEPAKGEYKNIFGDIPVYGTNPQITKLLHINPFKFPTGDNGIHVLEHIDRLVEIFNVCWPMYAAMPAILKKAVLSCYEKCGWDLIHSQNPYDLFPTFIDLQQELVHVINDSAYSAELKSNYVGSLVTRVESLANGINGEIFTSTDLCDQILFDENAIVDLSRVGSQETKSLIMGLLIMRLNEYRMSTAKDANASLHHVTILEEAHNILKRTSTEQTMEGGNVAGKSVEMLTNAIAEMRTYGEGFLIVDQSPTSVAPAAIKNTNTKIIMRLPDGDDRKITGKSVGMKDNQIDEIAKLPTGVAVVYQNNWVEPVLCKIDMYQGTRTQYVPVNETVAFDNSKAIYTEILKLLLKGRYPCEIDVDIEFIQTNIYKLKIATYVKLAVLKIIKQLNKNQVNIWEDNNFIELSSLISNLLNAQSIVGSYVKTCKDFNELDILLDRFIEQHASIHTNLKLLVRQCLLRQYAEKDGTSMKIYDAWLNNIQNKIV